MSPNYWSSRGFVARALALVCLLGNAQCRTDAPKENFAKPRAGSGAKPSSTQDSSTKMDASVADAGAPDSGGELIGASCGDAPVTNGDFTRELLRSASAECAVWQYCVFQAAAQALDSAVSAYASDRGEQQLKAARSAWLQAMSLWSRAELFQFGPAASSAQSAGKDTYQGKGLRDRIYAWPSAARCRVEEEIVDGTSNVDNVLISGRGLFALEYVLFYEGSDTACAASGQVASEWNGLGADALAERKANYAAAVAADVRKQADALMDVWSPDGGDFKQVFVSASGYPNEQEAMNVLGWALVYIEKEVKDWKLGIPAGVTQTSPVSGPEAPFAHVATQNIQQNLRGFRALFQGCGSDGAGIGFDDWLISAGHEDLAKEMIEAYEAAQSTLDKLSPLHENKAADIEAAYSSLRTLTTLMKSDLFGAGSPLNLKLPASVEGDTD